MRQLKSKGEIRVEEKDNGEARIKKDRETNDTFSDVHIRRKLEILLASFFLKFLNSIVCEIDLTLLPMADK
jgi:hypothetical protein